MDVLKDIMSRLEGLIKKTNYSLVFDNNATDFDRETKRIAHILAEQLMIATMQIKDSDGKIIPNQSILKATVEKLVKFTTPVTNFMAPEKMTEILQQTDIVEVIRKYIDLQESGDNYIGCCAFHKEQTPSFSVNKSKQHFHCFGCGASGDVIEFITKYFDLSINEGFIKLEGYINDKQAKQ